MHRTWLWMVLLATLALLVVAGCQEAPPVSAPSSSARGVAAAAPIESPPPRTLATSTSVAAVPTAVPPATPTRVPTPAPTFTPAPPTPTPTPVVPPPRLRADAPAPPPVTARHYAVIDGASGALLLGQEPHQRVAPASVTKVATLLVALELGVNMDEMVTATVDASEMLLRDGSQVMGLHPDERVSMRTLLHGLMLWSGNDAAEQLAVYLGAGSRKRYVEWMNLLVERIGLEDTHFVTPSGMDAPGHYSSAYDMAMLARYAMQNDTFRTLVGTPYYEGDDYPIPNINAFLTAYPGADGVKTGFTDNAGRTLVASATRDGRRVFVSLMNSANLVADATALMDWAFAAHEWPR